MSLAKWLLNRSYLTIIVLIGLSAIILFELWREIKALRYEGFAKLSRTSGTCAQGIPTEKYDGSTSHTVNLPLTTTTSCRNFCGPAARCAITGQQCFADIDCPGCQPQTSKDSPSVVSPPIGGEDDAGKLTTAMTPQYSVLTTGYGTKQALFAPPNRPAVQPNFGVNTWRDEYDVGANLFSQRYEWHS